MATDGLISDWGEFPAEEKGRGKMLMLSNTSQALKDEAPNDTQEKGAGKAL
jgi:hypothetical protein